MGNLLCRENYEINNLRPTDGMCVRASAGTRLHIRLFIHTTRNFNILPQATTTISSNSKHINIMKMMRSNAFNIFYFIFNYAHFASVADTGRRGNRYQSILSSRRNASGELYMLQFDTVRIVGMENK